MNKVDQRELEKARMELEEFLDAHPDMRAFQKEIDRVLDASTDRLEVIGIMLASKFSELNNHMQGLL